MGSTAPPETTAPPGGTWFGHWLHRSYHQGAGLRLFLGRRILPAGWVLGGLFFTSAYLTLGAGGGPVFLLVSLCAGISAISVPWALVRNARLQARRELPPHATAGVPIRYSVVVTNAGKRKISRAWLAETPPDPRPALADFLLLREPGEHRRNAFDRSFAYFRWQWLLVKNRAFSGGKSGREITLLPGEAERVFIELTPERRGIIPLDDLRAGLPDPLGIVQRFRKVPAPAGCLTVLPRRFPLPALELPGGNSMRIHGEATTNVRGGTGEFVGLRDYRPGDPPRNIHWKSWARTGRPIVKELEDTYYPRYGLVLDTFSLAEDEEDFEGAVSVAASFAAGITDSETLLDLMFIGDEAIRVTAGRNVERTGKLLEALAAVKPVRTENFDSLGQLVRRHQEDLASCIVVLNGWDARRAEFLRTLSRDGLACVPIVISAAGSEAPGYRVRAAEIAADLSRLPARLAAF